MSIRDFIALHSTPPSPTPIAAVLEIPKPIVLEPSNLDLEATAASSASCENVLEDGAPFHWDVESRSAAKLGKGKESVGARAYAEHPSTEVLCVSFARGNGPVETWVPGQPIPEAVLAAAADPRCLLGRA